MPQTPSAAGPIPPAFRWAISLIVLAHLSAVGLQTLAASSGPWATPFGPSEAQAPAFAQELAGNFLAPAYLKPLHMTHTYHFESNKTPPNAAYFEVHLKDKLGGVRVVRFPDEKANFWMRHRQEQLALWLAEDEPLERRGTEKVAAPRQKLEEIEFWEMTEPNVLRLKKVPDILAPRNPEVMRPTERAKMLAAAYLRFLCREHGAASAELVRCSRQTVYPMVLFMPEPPREEALATLRSFFGEYRHEK